MLLDFFSFLLIVVIWILSRLIMLAIRVIKKLLALKERERRKIPKSVKDAVWSRYIGMDKADQVHTLNLRKDLILNNPIH